MLAPDRVTPIVNHAEIPNSVKAKSPRFYIGGLPLSSGGEVDSSDDEEGFELEPGPVFADPIVLATADMFHEVCSDDVWSEDDTSSEV